MGLIKFSGLVTGIIGKLNGSVFTKNKAGAIIKNKQTPINQQSGLQQNNRSSINFLSKKWRELSDSQRIEWNALARRIILNNYWGDSYNPSGFNVFCRLNQNLFLIDKPYIFDAPEQVTVPVLQNVTCNPIIQGIASMILTFNEQQSDLNVIHLIYASPGISQGIYYNKVNYKIIGFIPVLQNNYYEAYADYISKYPAPKAGRKIFFKLRGIDINTGFDAIGSHFNRIVTKIWTGIGFYSIGHTFIIH